VHSKERTILQQVQGAVLRVPLINPTTVLFVSLFLLLTFFFFRYIVQNDLLGPIFDLFVKKWKKKQHDQ